ncbi:hypothetical protein EJ06DRAFT_480966 [Trichodelitschia bisporula]|uniref:Uncharacterized protein n=1 Tax=Trichodelitschia bisporula TaxID=703511 RepID=A0A6G1HQ25_9PEZI|nr:hypothetical protein EJ06DRAFT_480966 [Trichodelitschia bisporula]
MGRPSSSGADLPPQAIRHRRQSSHDKRQAAARRGRAWPPNGCSKRSKLRPHDADDLITRGASTFRGFREGIGHAPGHYRFFAVMDQESSSRTDRASFQNEAFRDISLTMSGPVEVVIPWVSLDQPCMAYCFGKSPGTTTLTHYVGKSGSLRPNIQYALGAKPRKMKAIAVMERLRELEMGLWEDADDTYHSLYDKLIEDPDRDHPHYDRAHQIHDLLTALCNPMWIDFSQPRNQVVAHFFNDADDAVSRRFFHQLLLSIELYWRIHAPDHVEKAKRNLLLQLPPKVAWDLALAQRWLDHMSIKKEQLSYNKSTFTFDLRSKNRQKEALRTFAKQLKWPNMDEIEYILEEDDPKEMNIEDRSSETMSWFTGVILPGPTLPFLLMNTLIDCDRDTGSELKSLTHMQPNCGFQYRANTYWSYQCIVGKVLGAGRGVNQVAGWIGPCHYTPELSRKQSVLIRQLDPLEPRLLSKDIETMSERTTPLGPDDVNYPVADYDVPTADTTSIQDNIIRIQKLSFEAVADRSSKSDRIHDAKIVFAFADKSVPILLRYNVDFIHAFPCHSGPHPLFWDYRYKQVRVDDGLGKITNWAQRNRRKHGGHRSTPSSPAARAGRALALTGRARSESPSNLPAHTDLVEVLVVEAYGVSDNEVFARAWCAFWGVSAVVANVKETCIACAVREAYAACVTVVILTEGGREDEGDQGVAF